MNNSTFLNMTDITNPESVEKYFNDVANNALYAQEQEVLENDYVSLAHKKLINASLTADAKRAFIKGRTLQKTLNMDGFEEQEVEIVDKDSGFILQRDESGNIISRTPIRLQAYGHYDGVDELKNVKKSAYKQANQPKFVSMLTGKPEHELTEYDYANVKAYETTEAYNAMTYTGKGMYQSARYNPSIDYTANKTPKSARVMVRLSGDDRYGRRLAEVVNPANGRDIGFEFANDPYANASFDLYKSLDTKANRAGVEAKYKRYDVQSISKTIADKYDTDSRIGEDLDMVQASFYRMWARIAQHGPEAIMDTEYWAKVADEATGQEIADAWAGVKTSTRRAIANEMAKGLDQWKNGDYIDSIITVGSQLDRLFAESAAQTITGIAIGAATGGIGLAAGASTATASTIAMVSGATASAIDNTLMSIEDYEANNGKAMSGADAAKTFAGYMALAIPETLFGALGIGKLLPKNITSSMNNVYKQGAKLSAGKHLVGGFLGEAAQEMGEESFGTYMSQYEKNAQSFGDILTSPETAVAGVAGGLMGGALAGLPAAKGFVFDARKEAKQDKEREEIVKQRQTKTIDNTDIDEVANDTAKAVVFSIAKQLASGAEISNSAEAVKQLDDVITSDGVSEETVADATKTKADLIRQQIDALKEINAKLDKLEEFRLTPAEALAEQASSANAANVFVRTGKRLTDEARQKTIEDLKDFGRSIGLDDTTIEKVLAEVIVEARDSWKGYNTYNKRIQKNLAVLDDPTADENAKTKAKASLTRSVEQTARFYSNQVSKLDALTSGLLRLVDTENLGTIAVEYPSTLGKKFTIKASNVVNKKHDSGVAKTFNAVLTEAKNIHKILAALPEEYAHQILKTLPLEHVETLQKTFNNAIDRAVASENAMFHSEHKEGIDAANAVRLVKQLKSGKQLSDKVEVSLKTRLASVSDKTLTQIQSLLDSDTSLSTEVKKDYIDTIKQLRSEVTTSKANVEATTKSQGPVIGAVRTTLNSYSNFKKHIKTAQHAGNAMRKLIEARKSLGTLVRTPEVVELAASITNLINEIDEHKKTLSEIHETDSIQNAKNALAKYKDISATSSSEDIAEAMKDLTNHIATLRKEKEEGNSTAAALLKAVTARYNVLSALGKSTTAKNKEDDKSRTVITNLRKYVANNRDKVQTKTIDGIEIKYYVVPDSLMNGDFGMALDWQTVLISEFATKSPKNKRTAYIDAFNRAEKHGINMHELAQNTNADTFTDLVLLHEYRHTQQRKLFDNTNEGVGRWELDSELFALLHTGSITQEQYNTIYNAELKPYVKERVQKQSTKPENQTQSVKSGLANLKAKYQQGLVKAGLTKEQANAVVTLLEANAKVMSKLFGVSVEEYLNTRFAGYQSITQKEFEEQFTKDVLKTIKPTYNKKGKIVKSVSTVYTFDETMLINLFEQSDVSAALHETANFFFREFHKTVEAGNTATWVTDAWKTMQEQYGFTGTLEDPVELLRLCKRFARDFEAYMREGKAPKPELQSIFDACKQWLKAIYRNITQILGKTNRLSPEMAKVFDKLLTEDSSTVVDKNVVEKPVQKTQTPKSETQYVNHSGGANGADTYWGTVGEKYGIVSKHYYGVGNKTPSGNTELTAEQLKEGHEKVKQANKSLKRRVIPLSDPRGTLLARNWFQVKNADAIFAVSRFNRDKNGEIINVDGGTAWAVQMAIDAGKPVYVFDQKEKEWYAYNVQAGTFWSMEGEIPILTPSFAGIGSRALEQSGKDAIDAVYEKTFKNTQQSKKDAVEQDTSTVSVSKKPNIQDMSPEELIAYYNSLNAMTFDDDARGVDDISATSSKTTTVSDTSNTSTTTATTAAASTADDIDPMQLIEQYKVLSQQTFDDDVRNAVDTTETVVIEEKEENNKPSELVAEVGGIDPLKRELIFVENHLNVNAATEHLYKEGALGDYKSNPMLNFGPTSVADKTGDNVRTVKTVKNGKEVTENIYVYSKPQVQLRGPLRHDIRPIPKNRIISNIMQTGVNNEAYLQHVASKMKYLFLDFYSKLPSKNTASMEKAEQKFTDLLRQNPHLALLYGTISGNTKDGTVKYKGGSIQANAAMAVDLACREFLSSMSVHATFNPTDAEDVCNAFGLDSTSLKYKSIKALRTEIEKHGIPRRSKAIRLGRMIAQHMQIAERKYDPKEPDLRPHFGIWENIIAGLGDWGLRYMEANGWITYDSIDGKVVNTNAESKVLKAEKITTIKIGNMNAIEQAVTSFLGPFENVTDADGNTVYDASGTAKRRRNGKGLKSMYFITKDSTEGPVTKPIKPLHSDEPMYIDGTQRMMLVPDYQREQVEQMQQVPHSINTELVELLTSYRDAVLDNLGYVPDSDLQALHQDSRSSAEGANLAITSQLRFLEEYMYRQLDEGVDWYFKGFVSKNGRIFYDSPTLNPQSGKTLTRFLVQPKQFYHEFKIGDEKHELFECFIISQAFDCLGKPEYSKNVQTAFNGLSAKVANEMLEDFVALKHSAFFEKYNPILSEIAGTDIKLDGVENYGQCLVVLQHIANKRAFVESGSKGAFNTWLSAEIDSTTSGYVIRALIYPTPEIIKEFGEKVGIVKAGTENADTPIHILKKKKGFLDIYKTLAARMIENIGDALTSNSVEKFKAIYQDYNAKKKANKKPTLKADVQNLSDVMSKLLAVLPTPEYDADGNIVISSALRSLMKPAVMVFGYTGGKISIIKNLSDVIMEDIFDAFYAIQHTGGKEAYIAKHNITDPKELERIDAILDTMQYVAGGLDTVEKYDGKTVKKKYDKTLQGLAAAIRDKSITNVRVKSGKSTLSLDEFFNEVLGPIYGESTWNALEDAFLKHTEYNDAVNLTAASMYQLFNNIWKPIQEALLRTEGLTESKYKEMLDALSEIWPSIPLIYTEVPALTEMETKDEKYARERKSILIGSFDIDTSLTGNVTNYTPLIGKDGNPEFNQFGVPAYKSSGVSLTSDTKVLANPKKFAAVGPVHYIDGVTLAMTLNRVFGIPVHDALVLAFDAIDEGSKQYNNALFEVGRNYNLFGIFVDRFDNMMDIYNNFNKDNPKYSKIFEYYKLITGKDLEITPIDELTVVDGFGKEAEDFISMQDLKNYLDQLRADNDRDRDWFYGQDWSIANMEAVTKEGIGHSGETTIQDILEISKEHHADMIEQYASPRGFVSNAQMEELLSNTNTDPNARLEIIDKLQELAETLGNKVENAEYVQEIKGLLKAINPERIKNYSLSVTQDTDFTGAKTNHIEQKVYLGFDNKKGADLDPVTGLSVRSLQSPVEMYAHELVHAAVRFGLVVLKTVKANSYIHKLLQIQKVAMDIITWEDFMPDDYDPNLKQVYEAQAKEAWDYIFVTGAGENLSALSEFISYGLTNPKIRAKLAQHTMVEQKAKLSVLDRLVSFFKNLIGVITGDAKLGDVAESFMDLVKGNRTVFASKHTLLQELDKFTVAISYADKKAVNNFTKHPYKAFELVYDAYRFMMTRGNKHITDMYKYVFNYLDNHGKQYVKTSQSKAGTLSDTKTFLKILARATFSSSNRKALHEILQGMTKGIQQSTLASIFRDVTTPDEDSSRLEMFGLAARQVDKNSKAISSLTYKEISNAFGRVLTTGETEALTKVCLFTDLQCLTKDMTLAQIKSVLTNSTELHSQIDYIEQRLKVLDTKDSMWLRNQAYGLARYMVTGIGNECQNLNARNIAAKLLLDDKAHEINEEVVSLVDKLATLYAVSFLDSSIKQVAANLPDTGLSVYLQHSKTFVDENISGVTRTGEDSRTVNEIHVIKGYTKQILDDSYDTTVAPIANQQALNNAGYILISALSPNNVTGAGALGLYRRSLTRPNRREGATFILNGAHAVGTTLKDSAFGVGAAETAEDVNDLVTHYKNTIRKNSAHLANMMKHKKMELVDFQAFSEGYTPIISPTTGEAIDYRITMSTENKVKHLGMELDGLQILSKMFASHNTKLEAKLKNHALIDYLYDHMHKHMKVDRRDEYGFTYTKISRDTDNKFLREAWKVIPDELKHRIEQEPLYVRTDWLQYLFGEPNMSAVQLLDALVKHKRPTWWKRAVAVAEMVLQTVAYGAKRATILFTPGVVINNQISNANYSAMTHGVGILKVLKMQLQNAQATRDYLDTKKAYNQILHRERIGTATEAEIKKKQWYKTKLENNIVHPLMKKGMYQSIVEDLDTTELEATGKLGKLVKNSTWFNKIPKPIRSLMRVLYLGEGTFISTFMTQLTQYSDFVARATEYQLQMEKAPERYEVYTFNGNKYKRETKAYRDYEHKVMVDVLNTFINYDKPQSSIEQYANDMGILQYTKFAKRIQGVVAKTVSKNPMGVIMFLITQGLLVDTEDILEQNLVSKSLSGLFYNPVDNFYNTVIPVPAQYLLDMRQMW